MENNKNNDRLILIGGGAQNSFDDNLQPIFRGDYKFLVIQDPVRGYTQLLVLAMYQPYEYHAEALLDHMKTTNLHEIKVNGGGKIELNPERGSCKIYGKSYAFKHVWPAEIQELVTALWPTLTFTNNAESSSQGPMETHGGTYSFAQVKYHVDNP